MRTLQEKHWNSYALRGRQRYALSWQALCVRTLRKEVQPERMFAIPALTS